MTESLTLAGLTFPGKAMTDSPSSRGTGDASVLGRSRPRRLSAALWNGVVAGLEALEELRPANAELEVVADGEAEVDVEGVVMLRGKDVMTCCS